jgi:hypothetical protein
MNYLKKISVTILIAASLCLGACASTGSLTATDITSFEDTILADSLAACQFEPSVASVVSLIANAVVPGASAVTTVASTIATQICTAEAAAAAASAKTVRRGGAMPAIVIPGMNGKPVTVTGHYVS